MKQLNVLLSYLSRIGLPKNSGVHLCLMLLVTSGTASAQQPSGDPTPSGVTRAKILANPAPSASHIDERYRIGPGDVLDIRVFNRPQLSREAVRVDARGLIRMPMIKDEIQAACQTESELAKEIAARYLEYQRNPYVDVFVKEYQSQPVAVIGAVDKPGRFQLQRRVRLLELLSFAGGPTERAGGRIQIVRPATGLRCEAPAATVPDGQTSSEVFVAYNLRDTLRGENESNPYAQPGDIVSLPEAEQAFVVGNVLRPSAIPLKEPVTVSGAIAMAGGLMPDTKGSKVRISRQVSGSKTEIFIDLKAIENHQAEDVTLIAGDIVDVPISGGKRFLRGLASAVFPAISNLPVQVVR